MTPRDIDDAARQLVTAQAEAREKAHAPVSDTPIYDDVVAVYPHIEPPDLVTVEDPHPATELLPIITVEAIEGGQR